MKEALFTLLFLEGVLLEPLVALVDNLLERPGVFALSRCSDIDVINLGHLKKE